MKTDFKKYALDTMRASRFLKDYYIHDTIAEMLAEQYPQFGKDIDGKARAISSLYSFAEIDPETGKPVHLGHHIVDRDGNWWLVNKTNDWWARRLRRSVRAVQNIMSTFEVCGLIKVRIVHYGDSAQRQRQTLFNFERYGELLMAAQKIEELREAQAIYPDVTVVHGFEKQGAQVEISEGVMHTMHDGHAHGAGGSCTPCTTVMHDLQNGHAHHAPKYIESRTREDQKKKIKIISSPAGTIAPTAQPASVASDSQLPQRPFPKPEKTDAAKQASAVALAPSAGSISLQPDGSLQIDSNAYKDPNTGRNATAQRELRGVKVGDNLMAICARILAPKSQTSINIIKMLMGIYNAKSAGSKMAKLTLSPENEFLDRKIHEAMDGYDYAGYEDFIKRPFTYAELAGLRLYLESDEYADNGYENAQSPERFFEYAVRFRANDPRFVLRYAESGHRLLRNILGLANDYVEQSNVYDMLDDLQNPDFDDEDEDDSEEYGDASYVLPIEAEALLNPRYSETRERDAFDEYYSKQTYYDRYGNEITND